MTDTNGSGSVAFEVAGLLRASTLSTTEVLGEIKARKLEDKRIEVIGYITGSVNGLSYRSNQYDDLPAYVLKGAFKGIPADGDRPEIRSDYCILPRTMNAQVVNAVLGEDGKHAIDKAPKRGQKLDVPFGNTIQFALEIGVRRSDTEIGYEYVVTMHGSEGFNLHDPLASLNAFLPAAAKTRLPALPRTAPAPQLAAPAAVPKAARKAPAGAKRAARK